MQWKNPIKRGWSRVVLVAILIGIALFSFGGEKVAHNDGIGWDGENYFTTMRHFVPMIKHHGYDQYAVRRVMPWGVTNIVCTLTHTEVTRNVAIASGIIYNSIALILSVLFFFRISNLLRWKKETEVMGFAFLFYTFLTLKMIGYFPVFSDVFALTLGIVLCYYFFAEKKIALVICGFIGAFVWPTSPLVAFALAFFPRKNLFPESTKISETDERIMKLLHVLVALAPLGVLLLCVFERGGHLMSAMKETLLLTLPLSSWIIPITCLCTCSYFYFIARGFRFSFSRVVNENLLDKRTWGNYILFLVCVLLTTCANVVLANGEEGALTAFQTVKLIMLSSMTDPFVFVENHFLAYGLAYLLVLLLWKDIVRIIMRLGLGYVLVVMLWALFSVRTEARVAVFFWVFPLMALLMCLDTKPLRPWAVIAAVVFSLFQARWWFPINVADMEKYLSWDNYWHYMEFPAQRYFLNFGHWQSHEMYCVFIALTVAVGLVLYVGIKKKWFVLWK